MVKLIQQHKVVKTFLLDREHQLEEFEPKKLTEEQQTKITDITNYLTGKSSNSFAKESKPASEDFEFEDNFAINYKHFDCRFER
jgi:hypothetical protein